MVRGGAAKATDLTPREREICAALAPSLRERGLLFVGIDVIDGNLTEINVTSPYGHSSDRAAWRAGRCGEDLGCDRKEARAALSCLVADGLLFWSRAVRVLGGAYGVEKSRHFNFQPIALGRERTGRGQYL